MADEIPLRPSQLDLRLHAASMVVGQLYSEAYYTASQTGATKDLVIADDLLIAFRCIRRHISLNSQGNRWGHASAHAICKGEI
jgi:hypothetical protein